MQASNSMLALVVVGLVCVPHFVAGNACAENSYVLSASAGCVPCPPLFYNPPGSSMPCTGCSLEATAQCLSWNSAVAANWTSAANWRRRVSPAAPYALPSEPCSNDTVVVDMVGLQNLTVVAEPSPANSVLHFRRLDLGRGSRLLLRGNVVFSIGGNSDCGVEPSATDVLGTVVASATGDLGRGPEELTSAAAPPTTALGFEMLQTTVLGQEATETSQAGEAAETSQAGEAPSPLATSEACPPPPVHIIHLRDNPSFPLGVRLNFNLLPLSFRPSLLNLTRFSCNLPIQPSAAQVSSIISDLIEVGPSQSFAPFAVRVRLELTTALSPGSTPMMYYRNASAPTSDLWEEATNVSVVSQSDVMFIQGFVSHFSYIIGAIAAVPSASSDGGATASRTTAVRVGLTSSLVANTARASAFSVAQETTVVGAAQETTVVGAAQETTVVGAAQETTVVGATQETSVVGAAQGTTVAGAAQETTISGAAQETTVAGAAQETTVAGAAQETTVAGAAQETTVAGAAQETTVAGAAQGTTVAGAAQETTVAGAAQGTTVAGAAQETTVAGALQETTISGAVVQETTAVAQETTATTQETTVTAPETTSAPSASPTFVVGGTSGNTAGAGGSSATIIAVVIVLLVVAALVVALFVWRRRRKSVALREEENADMKRVNSRRSSAAVLLSGIGSRSSAVGEELEGPVNQMFGNLTQNPLVFNIEMDTLPPRTRVNPFISAKPSNDVMLTPDILTFIPPATADTAAKVDDSRTPAYTPPSSSGYEDIDAVEVHPPASWRRSGVGAVAMVPAAGGGPPALLSLSTNNNDYSEIADNASQAPSYASIGKAVYMGVHVSNAYHGGARGDSEGEYARLPAPRARPPAYATYVPFAPPNADPLKQNSGELDPTSLVLGETLGQGAFGCVVRAQLHHSSGVVVDVAVKTMTDPSPGEIYAFRKEINMLERVRHKHITCMIGKVTLPPNQPLQWRIVLELGLCNLLTFLEENPLSSTDQLFISLQIVSACVHLVSSGFVHRDLAARNCLVFKNSSGNNYVVKLTDFGLTRELTAADANDGRWEAAYQQSNASKIPPSAAPEMHWGESTEKSDVFMFAFLLFEIYSGGAEIPYSSPYYKELYGPPPKPLPVLECQAEVAAVLDSCLAQEPAKRPTFVTIGRELEALRNSSSI